MQSEQPGTDRRAEPAGDSRAELASEGAADPSADRLVAAVAEPRRDLRSLLRSVVKVLTVSDAPDYEQPWQTQGTETSTGSGAIVETPKGLRVLTNAHCVADQIFVEVRRYGKGQKFEAEVEAVGHECDLALLAVADEEFFQGTIPIPIGDLPQLGERVQVCGYPIGGERLSITQGIVSRIDLVNYAQSERRLLAVQIDAAINAGNSGGPVIQEGHLVGVAFQSLDEAEKISYAIAPPIVRHFIEDASSGSYRGFPSLGVRVQALESAAHRRFLGIGSRGGVLITDIAHGGSAQDHLRVGDVLLAVDDIPIHVDGTVELREGELVDHEDVVSRRHVGDRINVTVWRDGAAEMLVVDLRPPSYLVGEDRYDVRPTYYVFGGLLLVPLTRNFLATWDEPFWQNAPRDLVTLQEQGMPTAGRQEVVILQKVLADRVNQGFHDYEHLVVTHVQGLPLVHLRHAIEIIESTAEPYVELRMADGRRVVVDRVQAEGRSEAILDRFGLPADRSDDLLSSATSDRAAE